MQYENEKLAKLIQAATSFTERRLPEFDYSNPYDLETDRGQKPWTLEDGAGVYAVFDTDWNLLHIGKAAFIAKKLSHMFPDSGECLDDVAFDWPAKPRFVVTISTKTKWDSAGLEAYLINSLQPKYKGALS